MTDTNGRRATSEERDEETLGRRRVLAATAGVVAVGLAGCSDDEDEDEEEPTETETGGGDDGTGSEDDGTETEEEDDGTETPDEETETPEEADDDGSDDQDDADVHEHGRLYVEIDGDRVDFSQPKYFQESEHPDGRAPHRFHFHEDDGEQYRWHMHGERLTLAEALEALPDIGYEHDDGHVVEVEGETYADGEGGTTVEFSERGTEIEPRDHELEDQDVLYVTVETDDGQ